MTKPKSTKRALLLSALSLLACVTMLIGSTFAWFTDSVTSSGNIIQSGTLDIVLEMYDKNTDTWVDAEGKIIPLVAADGRTEILWEPNCTYEMAPIRIRNAGDLAVYAMVAINGISGDEKLLEAIEFSTVVSNLAEANEKALIQRGMDDVVDGTATVSPIPGTPWGTLLWDATLMPEGEVYNGLTHISDTLTFVGHMKAEAGNEYQGLSIEGISITVVATQSMYEKDSFGYTYDRYATPPIVTVVRNAAELKEAVAAGGDIVLSNDIELQGEDLQLMDTSVGQTAQSMFSVIGDKDVTVDLNGNTIYVDTEGGTNVWTVFYAGQGANLTVTGGRIEFNSLGRTGGTAAFTAYGADSVITLKDVEVEQIGEGSVTQMIYVHGASQDLGKIYVEGGTYIQKQPTSATNPFYEQGGVNTNIIVSGGTYKVYHDVDLTKYMTLAEGYELTLTNTDDDGAKWYTVVAK